MSLSLLQYKDVLTVALDHQLAQLKGSIVFDDFDPAIEGDKINRARVERLFKQKKVHLLESMLQDLIKWFQFNDKNNFASILLQKTGYKMEPMPFTHKSVSIHRRIRVDMSGTGEQRLTFVSIELPTGSGSIYSIKGTHPELKADWKDEYTIDVQIPVIRKEIKRINQVRAYGETIKILYREL